MTVCPTCKAPVLGSEASCGSCGTKLVAPTTAPSPTQVSTTPDVAQAAAKPFAAVPSTPSVAATIEEAPRQLRTLSYLVMAAAAVSATAMIPGLLMLPHQGDLTFAAQQSSENLAGIASLLWGWGFTVGLILFMVLLYQLRHNLNRLNVSGQRYGADQAIWPWLIPVFNLFRPVRFVSDLYRGLNGRGKHPGREIFVTRRVVQTSPVIAAWWTAWVLQVPLLLIKVLAFITGETVGALLFEALIRGAFGALTVVVVYQLFQLNRKAIAAFNTPTAAI
jgi:hypothetical protein